MAACPKCGGSGRWVGQYGGRGPCFRCNATGRVGDVVVSLRDVAPEFGAVGVGRKAVAERAATAERGGLSLVDVMPPLPAAAPVRTDKFAARLAAVRAETLAATALVPEPKRKRTYEEIFGEESSSPKPAAVVPAPAPVVPAPVVPLHGLRNGYFTVVLGGDLGRITLRVQEDDWSGPHKSGVPGQQAVAYLNGPDNWRNYKSFAFVKDATYRAFQSAPERAVTALRFLMGAGAADLKGAAEAYAVESSRCSRCHRMLTVPASIHAGLGPDCATKGEY